MFQIYLVTGGYVGNGYLKSTEIYEEGKWSFADELPQALMSLRAVSLNNNILVSGNK